jgi:hypothetical protein
VPSALAHNSRPNIIVFQVTEFYWTPCGHPPCSHIVHTCQPSHFSKTYWLPTTYDDLLLSMPALFNCNYTSTCVQHLDKSYTIWLHTFLLHLFKIAPVPFALARISHVPPSQHSKRPHFVRTFCQNTLHAATFCTHPNQAIPHRSSRFTTLWIICSWACLLSLIATRLPHAFSTPTEMSRSYCTSSCCILL